MNKHEQALHDIQQLMKRVKITFQIKDSLTLIVDDSIVKEDRETLERSIKNLGAIQVNKLLQGV